MGKNFIIIINYVLIVLGAFCAKSRAQTQDMSPSSALDAIENHSDLEKLDISYLAKSKGFIIESHNVQTKDHYTLTIHRLVNPLMVKNQTRGVIVIQHGILCTSSIFLLNPSPNPNLDKPKLIKSPFKANATMSNSLPIALVNRGYDVWLTNFRGNQYGLSHATLSSTDPEFWDFNADTLIEQDLEASISYILKKSRAKTYTYIAHSLGTTVGLGSLLVHRDSPIAKNLSCSILMAPVASTKYMKGGLLPIFRLATLLYDDLAPFPGNSRTVASFFRSMCMFIPRACAWFSSSILGVYQDTVNGTRVEHLDELNHDAFVLMMHQSVSVKLLKHILQVNKSGKLCRFDHGEPTNLNRYGSSHAPNYNLSTIRQPNLKIALVSGPTDAISTSGEVAWIKNQLRHSVPLIEDMRIPVNPFNHMDLVLSKDAGRLVNKNVVNFMERNKCSRTPVIINDSKPYSLQ